MYKVCCGMFTRTPPTSNGSPRLCADAKPGTSKTHLPLHFVMRVLVAPSRLTQVPLPATCALLDAQPTPQDSPCVKHVFPAACKPQQEPALATAVQQGVWPRVKGQARAPCAWPVE